MNLVLCTLPCDIISVCKDSLKYIEQVSRFKLKIEICNFQRDAPKKAFLHERGRKLKIKNAMLP